MKLFLNKLLNEFVNNIYIFKYICWKKNDKKKNEMINITNNWTIKKMIQKIPFLL